MSGLDGVREYLLAFADDEHLMGQQHTEWIGVAPFLEEDLAFSSIGQDELGHAALLYELVLDLDGIEPTDTAVDTLAYGRTAGDYRSCHLVEHTTTDWAEALVRHWIYDTFEAMRWQLVSDSSLPKLAAIARRALREEAYHRRHADALLDKLLVSPEPNERILDALDSVGPLIEGLCEPVAGEVEAVRESVASATTNGLLEPLNRAIAKRFSLSATQPPATAAEGPLGRVGGDDDEPLDDDEDTAAEGPLGRAGETVGDQRGRTRRSADFEPLLARMREVLDYDPEAVW